MSLFNTLAGYRTHLTLVAQAGLVIAVQAGWITTEQQQAFGLLLTSLGLSTVRMGIANTAQVQAIQTERLSDKVDTNTAIALEVADTAKHTANVAEHIADIQAGPTERDPLGQRHMRPQ